MTFVGEVIIQRLNLQILWTQPAPTDDSKVCGIDWRPDERILAIGKQRKDQTYCCWNSKLNFFFEIRK